MVESEAVELTVQGNEYTTFSINVQVITWQTETLLQWDIRTRYPFRCRSLLDEGSLLLEGLFSRCVMVAQELLVLLVRVRILTREKTDLT